jgi:CubicO group peptidase (beta-lactamase class C family)
MLKRFVLLLFCLNCSIAGAQLYYPPTTGTTWATTDPATLGWCAEAITTLYSYLEHSNTKGFMVLKDGRIVLEKYFGTFGKDGLSTWNSAGKTLTSFAIGIAQEDGYLDIQDSTSEYLGPGWSSLGAEREARITIRHHLTMTTGLNDGVPDDDCTNPECLQYLAAPGTRWAYHNAPYTVLESVLDAATGVSLNQWVTQKIKSPTGMNGTYRTVGYNSIFVSTLRSMARFGLLLQSGGYWNGYPVLNDNKYFREMTHSSQMLNPAYGYLTWLNGQKSYRVPGSQVLFRGPTLPHAPADVFAADGKDGQLINVSPSGGLVLVRMGKANGNSQQYNDTIWQYMNRLTTGSCQKTGAGD